MDFKPNQRYIITQDLSKLAGTEFERKEKIVSSDVFKILQYRMDSHRMRNKDGEPVRSTPAGRFIMTIQSEGDQPYTKFYEALSSNSSVQWTIKDGFLHDDGMYSSYSDCYIIDFYVMKMHEHYSINRKEGRQYLGITVECLVKDLQQIKPKAK